MSENEIQLLEFEKFKRKLISCVTQMTIDDHVTLIIEHGEPVKCNECGKMHKGTRCLSNVSMNITFMHADLLFRKGTEQLLGIDNNKWGRPKEN